MLRFFSKIRLKLAAKNKPVKYLRYAIGEIILVVIGILIALQVNNWNENRKLRNTEKALLTELVKELRTDSTTIRFNTKIHEQAKKSCTIILNAIERDLEYNDSLSFHFAAANYYTRFASSQGAYESLKTAGLETVSNKSLRFQIIQYYETSNVIHNENLDLNTEYIVHLQKVFYPGLFKQFKIIDKDHIYKGEMIPIDFDRLKQNTEFRYHFQTLQNNHEIINELLNKGKLEMVENLISKCLKEIRNIK